MVHAEKVASSQKDDGVVEGCFVRGFVTLALYYSRRGLIDKGLSALMRAAIGITINCSEV